MNRYLTLFRKYLGPIKLKVGLLAILVFAGIGLQLINPLIIRYFIDTLMAHGDMQSMLLAALTFLGVSVLTQLTGIASVYVGEGVGWRATNQLRGDLTLHCLKLDMSFHTAHTPGEMIERIDGDLLALSNFFSRFIINVLGNLLLLIGVLVILAFIDIRVSIAILIYLAVGVGAMVGLRRIAIPYWAVSRQTNADLFGLLEEQLSGTEDIRASGSVAHAIRNLLSLNKLRLKADIKSTVATSFIFILWIVLYIIGQIVAFSLSYTLLQAGLITIGTVYLIIYFTFFVFQRFQDLSNELQNIQQAMASLERVEKLMSVKSKIKNASAAVDLPAGALGVTFDQVTFGYSDETPVLKSLSFQLLPGKTLGLLGRTGSGKTTIARLLFRLYDPLSGSIRLDSIGLEHIKLQNLRQRIGMVTQTVQLFDASVRDNLTFFDHHIPDEKITQALTDLGLADWLAALPDGLDTRLSAGGGQFSAGESQLIAFARVFLLDPGIVILDEASSRLDPLTERRIKHAIQKLLENRTGIIIAHRLHTVEQVDHIMIINDGNIVEFGERNALVNNTSSNFYQLLQTGLQEVLA
jgi:ABC-type multidrug transport system fused ATPase/permease subunit